MSGGISRTVRANGIAQHVLEWPGPPERTVALLHGYLDQASSFRDIGDALAAAGFRVFALDFRGHGRSGWVPAGGYYHFADYVADLAALLDVVAPIALAPTIDIVAHSMGGTVATLFTGTYPERVRALALLEGVGPPPMPADVAPDRMRRWLEGLAKPRVRERKRIATVAEAVTRLHSTHGGAVSDTVLARIAADLLEPHPDGEGFTWRFDPLHQTSSPTRFDAEAFSEFARRITARVLLVEGGDSVFRYPGAEARYALYANRRLVTIEGAGHMMHWTDSPRVAGEVVGFLK